MRPRRGLTPSTWKEPRGHPQPRNLLRLLPGARCREVIAAARGIKDGHSFERMALPLEIPEVRRGDDVQIIGTLAKGFPDQHQAVGFGETAAASVACY